MVNYKGSFNHIVAILAISEDNFGKYPDWDFKKAYETLKDTINSQKSFIDSSKILEGLLKDAESPKNKGLYLGKKGKKKFYSES